MGPTIAVAEEYRCFEDFDTRASNQKKDFYRKWYHTQTMHPQVSLDGFKTDYAEELRWSGMGYRKTSQRISSNESTVKVLAEQFMETLSEKDKQILQLRLEGYTMEEVAEKLGYANLTEKESFKHLLMIIGRCFFDARISPGFII